MQPPRATGKQVNVPDRPVGGSTTGPGAVDTGVEARGRPADKGTGGSGDDENTNRELVPRTSSAVEVAWSCMLHWVVEEVATRSSRRCCEWSGENPPWRGQRPGAKEQSLRHRAVVG